MNGRVIERISYIPKKTPNPVSQHATAQTDMPCLSDVYWQPMAGNAASLYPQLQIDGDNHIEKFNMSIASSDLIRRMSVAHINSSLPYVTSDQGSLHGTLYDPRLGHGAQVNGLATECTTCFQDYNNCPGHVGHIELPCAIVNPLFQQLVCNVLQTICVKCCQLRVSPYLIFAQFPIHSTGSHNRMLQRLKKISLVCARYMHCQFCAASTLLFRLHGLCVHASHSNRSSSSVPIPPGVIMHILNRVPLLHYQALGFRTDANHPVFAIMTAIPVIPPIARPSTHNKNSKTGQPFCSEDGIVLEYRTIISHCTTIRNCRNSNTVYNAFAEINHSYERITMDQGRMYCVGQRDSQQPRRPSTLCSTKTAIRRRLAGKTGRQRRDGMGKRVNTCARTVATCNSILGCDEISIPRCILANITKAVQVQIFNIAKMKHTMQQGKVYRMSTSISESTSPLQVSQIALWKPDVLMLGDTLIRNNRRYKLFIMGNDVDLCKLEAPPHAPDDTPLPIPQKVTVNGCICTISQLCHGDKIMHCNDGTVSDPCDLLDWPDVQIGFILWTTYTDGDIVLVNRQPTLVQESMLAMRIRESSDGLSFGLSCAPIEAMRGDYDGDEINVHFPQNTAALTELSELMSISQQIVTGQAGKPVVQPIQDAVVAWHWLTPVPTCWHTLSIFQQLAAQIEGISFGQLMSRMHSLRARWLQFCVQEPLHATVQLSLQRDDGLESWCHSGMALMSLLLPDNCPCFEYVINDTLCKLHYRYNSQLINIRIISGGLYVQGAITSSSLGGRGGILHRIFLYYGGHKASQFLTNIQKIASYVSMYGYCISIGLNDCVLPPALVAKAQGLMEMHISNLRESEFHDIQRRVSCRAESEALIIGNIFRNKEISSFATLCMLGTKGSVSNLLQCCLCLGQQVVEGVTDIEDEAAHTHSFPTLHNNQYSRLEFSGLLHRTSFVSGLDPCSFLVHARAGREALVEGACKTAQSGYAMRLGIKMSENVTVAWDHTIRSGKQIIQFAYNYGTGRDNCFSYNCGIFFDLESYIYQHKSCTQISVP